MPYTPFTFAQPIWLGETTSTSDVLKERLAANPDMASGTVIAAHRQTRGRGRMGNAWQSAAEGDLTFSFYRRGGQGPAALGTLPMALALGVRDFLAAPPRNVPSLCKWPNDVLVNDGKICGILAEGGPLAGGGFGLVVGIGVNLRVVPDRDPSIGRKTAALEQFSRSPSSAEELLPVLLGHLRNRIRKWEEGGFPAIREDLVASLWGMGREVTARTPGGRVTGIVVGLGGDGELALRIHTGELVEINSVTAIEAGWEGTSI